MIINQSKQQSFQKEMNLFYQLLILLYRSSMNKGLTDFRSVKTTHFTKLDSVFFLYSTPQYEFNETH